MGRLTTHVLDTSAGRPAAELPIELYRHDGQYQHLKSVLTNSDGRVDEALLEGDEFNAAVYELRFDVAAYYNHQGAAATPSFYDVVPIRFTVTDPRQHYHVPLLLSPFGYSTYRGS